MQKIAIIIPCYNEELRLKTDALHGLLALTNIDIYLANDGSTDSTLLKLEAFSGKHNDRCKVLNFEKNEGKAATIFKSVNHVLLQGKYDYIGYFDADFSTPVSEMLRMINEVENTRPGFLFGSRILLLNAKIKRKKHRHIIGRIIITLINLKFNLGVYDTQCGAKIFSEDMATLAFKNKFYTSWLFDVEVFIRLRKQGRLFKGVEFPLQQWEDIEGSKLGWKTGFKILRELYMLHKFY